MMLQRLHFGPKTDDDRSDMLSFVSAKFQFVLAFTKHHNKNVVQYTIHLAKVVPCYMKNIKNQHQFYSISSKKVMLHLRKGSKM